jgi:hypothetical protein
MGNGKWVKGKESALLSPLGAGLRPATLVLAAAASFRFILRSGMRGRVGDKVCSDRVLREAEGLFR